MAPKNHPNTVEHGVADVPGHPTGDGNTTEQPSDSGATSTKVQEPPAEAATKQAEHAAGALLPRRPIRRREWRRAAAKRGVRRAAASVTAPSPLAAISGARSTLLTAAVALLVGAGGGLGFGWHFWRPKSVVETPAASVRQPDSSLVLRRAPDAHAKPAQDIPNGATVERVVHVEVQPKAEVPAAEPPSIMPAPTTPASSAEGSTSASTELFLQISHMRHRFRVLRSASTLPLLRKRSVGRHRARGRLEQRRDGAGFRLRGSSGRHSGGSSRPGVVCRPDLGRGGQRRRCESDARSRPAPCHRRGPARAAAGNDPDAGGRIAGG